MGAEMSDKQRAVDEFDEYLLDAIDKARAGDYSRCVTIVEAFRRVKGDEGAQAARRMLWRMIKESKI